MKTPIFILLLFLGMTVTNLSAQDSNYSEKHGNTLNLGFGVGGYSGYYGNTVSTLPVFNINYERPLTPKCTPPTSIWQLTVTKVIPEAKSTPVLDAWAGMV